MQPSNNKFMEAPQPQFTSKVKQNKNELGHTIQPLKFQLTDSDLKQLEINVV